MNKNLSINDILTIKKVSLVLLAGGYSRRFNDDNKLLKLVDNIPVFVHSLIKFAKFINYENIFLICKIDEMQKYKDIVDKYFCENSINFISGGIDRMHSVFNGLCAINNKTDIIVIHDAARPMFSIELLEKCIFSCYKNGNGIASIKLVDSLKLTDNEKNVIKTIRRDNLWRIQTPQVFIFNELLKTYKMFIDKNVNFTDDSEIMENAGYKIFLVENFDFNDKITYRNDLNFISKYYDKHHYNVN